MVTLAGSESRALESEDVDVSAKTGGATAGLVLEAVTLLAARRDSTLGSTTAEATTMTTTAEATPREYGRQFMNKEVGTRRLFSPNASGVNRTPSAEALSMNLCRYLAPCNC